MKRTPLKRKSTRPKRRAVSPASPGQRVKVKDAPSIVSGDGPCDPAHLVPRSLGGCDDPLCVIPLTRAEHRLYDRGELDLSPHLITARAIPELAHALTHVNGSLLRLVHIVTGERHVPRDPPQD